MRAIDFITNSARQYLGAPESIRKAAQLPPPAPVRDTREVELEKAREQLRASQTQIERLIKVQQGRITDPNEIERHEPMEAPLISERFSYVDLRNFLKLYGNHVWTYRCSSVIAASCASVKFVWKENGNLVPTNKLSGFYIKPNSYMTWHDLIEVAFIHLELAGNAFWEVQRDAKGKIVAIYPLRPDRVRIIPDAKKRIKRYEYWVPGAADYIKYEPQEILHLKYADSMSEYYGIPAAAAASNDVIQDLYMTAWNKKFFIEGATPGGVLKTPNTLTEIAYNRLMKVFARKHRGNPAEIAILEEGLDFVPVGSKHTDMQYLQGKEQQRDVIIAAYGVPPIMVGVPGRASGTANDEKKIFWQHNVIPKIQRLENFLNDFLLLTGFQIDFITKTLATIIEDEKIKADIAQSNVNHGIWTINEARSIEWDMPPVEWGDTWWAPVGLYDVKNPNKTHPTAIAAKYAAQQAAAAPGVGKDPIGRAQPGVGETATAGSPTQVAAQKQPVGRPKIKSEDDHIWIDKRELAEPDWTNRQQVADYTEYLVWKQSAGPDERELYKRVRGLFAEQGERIIASLNNHWPFRKADGENDDLIVDAVFDAQQEDNSTRVVLMAGAEKLLKKYGSALLSSLGINKDFRLTNDRVQKFLTDYAAEKVRIINETTRNLLREALSEAYKNETPYKELIGKIADIFDGDVSVSRAERIARTEMVTLTNTARYEAAVDSGVVQYKRWISEQIPTTRQRPGGENHVILHGVVKALDEPFEARSRTGVDMMSAPGDLNASGENVCGCLCIASYYSGTSEFADLLLPDGVPAADSGEAP